MDWKDLYKERCGVELNTLFDFGGPLNEAPIGAHVEIPLVKEGWSAWANGAVSTEICNFNLCINVCQLEKNIRARLDGNVPRCLS